MRSINKVIVIGNLTRDPEMRSTPNGQTVTTFGIATNREWITKDGTKKNSAEFHECVAWARLAEICANHLKKGRLVYIEGYLKTRNWDKDGQRKFKTEVVVQDMIMLEKKENEEDYLPETDPDPFPNLDEAEESRTISSKKEIQTPSDKQSKEANSKKDLSNSSISYGTSPSEDKFPTEDKNSEEALAPEVEKTSEENEENPIDKDLGL